MINKIRNVTREAWAFTAIAWPVLGAANGFGFDGVAVGIFAASIVIGGAAILGTLTLGFRSLVID